MVANIPSKLQSIPGPKSVDGWDCENTVSGLGTRLSLTPYGPSSCPQVRGLNCCCHRSIQGFIFLELQSDEKCQPVTSRERLRRGRGNGYCFENRWSMRKLKTRLTIPEVKCWICEESCEESCVENDHGKNWMLLFCFAYSFCVKRRR